MPVSRDSDPSSLFEEARGGSRVALARLLSMVERGGEGSRMVAGLAFKSPGEAYTVGITGAPGAGKSTLTDRLITLARERGLDGGGQVGVLAIDPSSPFSGGAILGDRVRMQSHALDDGVFIRSMATRGHLGGLSVAVPNAVRVLSAVGMPVVMVETVGVGQQEVAVAAATDTTVVVLNPGWGDHIQANKAGLLEVADLFVINKADRPGAGETRRDLEAMLELTPLDEGEWRPPIVETVASTGDGVDDLWAAIGRHRRHQMDSGLLAAARRRRLLGEFDQLLVARVRQQIEEVLAADQFVDITEAMVAGDLDPYEAVDRVLAAMAPDRYPPVPDP
jgi:LAO/AO transport system kinase